MDRTTIETELGRLRALAAQQDQVAEQIIARFSELKTNRHATTGAIQVLEGLLAPPPLPKPRKRR